MKEKLVLKIIKNVILDPMVRGSLKKVFMAGLVVRDGLSSVSEKGVDHRLDLAEYAWKEISKRCL